MTSDLYQLRQEFITHQQINQGAPFKPSSSLVTASGGYVLVDAVATDESLVESLISELEALGIRGVSSFGRVISGEIPLFALNNVERIEALAFMRQSLSIARAGVVTSQGDEAMFADTARSVYAVDGSGVMVGTLSDSYDCLGDAATDVSSGDLPTGVTVLDDSGCPGGSDEGRAMMQIITDVAPGAMQMFHTAAGGMADFANGIGELRTAGADVIVDDVLYLAEPFFQDGIVAQAVDAVVADGASYFSAAGNAGRESHEGAFEPSGTAMLWGTDGSAHDFDSGPAVLDIFQSVSIPANEQVVIVLQWDEPAASAGGVGASNDLDFALFNAAGTAVLAASDSVNVDGDPLEILEFQNTTGSTDFNLLVERYLPSGGSDPGLFKFVVLQGDVTINEYVTASSTVVGHANAEGAYAVGAANYADTPRFGTTPPVAAPYSSAGSTDILFDMAGTRLGTPETRAKPDLVAPDGVNNTFFGADLMPSDDAGTPFPNFFGTSASAPHAAAVAALYRQLADDTGSMFSSVVLENRLKATAVDMDAAGPDDNTGFGLINAENALYTPVLDSPVDGSTLAAGSDVFTFNWGPLPVTQISHWNLTVGAAPFGTDYTVTPTTATTASVSGYPTDGSLVYSTLQYSIDGGVNFEVVAFVHSAPSDTYPTDTITERSPTFIWPSDPGASHYRLLVDDAVLGIAYYSSWIPAASAGCASGSSCSFLPPNLFLALGKFRWRWKSFVPATGQGGWNHSEILTVAASASPGTVTGPLSPAGTATSSPDYSWGRDQESLKYFLVVIDSLNQVVLSKGYLATILGCPREEATCTVANPTPLLAPGTYRWRVRGYNREFVIGPWNAYQSFTVP